VSARILIIEDNATNMELMVYLLRAFGYSRRRPAMAKRGGAGRAAPDLIICDVHLPKLDGYGVVAALKADPGAPHSGAGRDGAGHGGRPRKAAEAGFDGYIGKPIEPDTFVGQIESFLKGAS
jgi:CheY-like chemotaxis protein